MEELDGGGTEIYQEIIDLLKQWYPGHKFDRTFEWCAGPGIIGFHLLDAGVTNTLCLADIYEPAVAAQKERSSYAQYQNYVSTYLSDNLKNIPDTEQWDLVVGNPPHFANSIQHAQNTPLRLYVDQSWQLHKEFFANIKKFLKPNAKIFLWEAAWGSSVETFRPWIEQAELRINRYGSAVTTEDKDYWYWIEIIND
jgi:methylase of polypeptide subunit release factors